MKKRNLIIYIYFVILSVFCYAQEYFYLKSDLEKDNETNEYLINSDKKLFLYSNYFIYIRNRFTYHGDALYEYDEILQFNDDDSSSILQIPADEVFLANYNSKVSSSFSDNLYVPEYYYRQFFSENRFDVVLKNESYWNDFDGRFWSGGAEIFDIFLLKTLNFRDYYFFISGNSWKRGVTFFAKIDNQEPNVLIYEVERVFDGSSDFNTTDLNENYDCVDTNLLPYLAENLPYKVYFVFDGDYVNMYVREIAEENLFQTFIRTTPKSCIAIENWIKGKSNDLSEVIWPHHADGTSEYEDTIRYPDPVVIEEPEEIKVVEYQEKIEENEEENYVPTPEEQYELERQAAEDNVDNFDDFMEYNKKYNYDEYKKNLPEYIGYLFLTRVLPIIVILLFILLVIKKIKNKQK